MALATQDSDIYLIWERLKTTVQTSRRCSVSSGTVTWYNCTHTSGSCRFAFLTKDWAANLAARLAATSGTVSVTCKNASFSESPVVTTYTFGPSGVTSDTVSKWTVEPVLRSDGVGFDVVVNIDYDEVTSIGS